MLAIWLAVGLWLVLEPPTFTESNPKAFCDRCKADRGVKDFGTIIAGYGGILVRVDSLTFAAPIFFHVTRFFYGA